MSAGREVFLFVIWSAARVHEERIVGEISRHFRILRDFEVEWPKRHFATNLAAFYGWHSWHVWRNKARKCGTGAFRVIVVEDASPVWVRERDTSGHELVVDANVYALKKSFRALTGRSNVVHSSVTREETAHQLAALDAPCDPIPFRPMVYADEARVRKSRRHVWYGLAGDVLVPLLATVCSGAIVWADVSVLGTNCAENGLVEWAGLVLAALCGVLMIVCAVRNKSGRGAYILVAAFFFDMVIREADFVVDRILGANIWPWALTAMTLTFTVLVVRFAKTVYSGLKVMRRSRRFPLFACGVALLLFVSQSLGSAALWRSLGVTHAQAFSHFIEESVELFSYVLMSAWCIPLVWRLSRRASARGAG